MIHKTRKKRDTIRTVNMTELAHKGGAARVASMTAEERKKLAQLAANARWSKKAAK